MVFVVLFEFMLNIIDCYLVVCEDMGIEFILVFNKIDLIDDEGFVFIDEIFDIY